MKWIVTGSWLIDGKAGRMTVEADSLRGAMDAAKAQGLSGFEAIAAGNGPAVLVAEPIVSSAAKDALNKVRMGLFVGWVLLLIGGILIPALGYLFAVLFTLWLVLLFAGLFVK